jgi:hypothetical protein
LSRFVAFVHLFRRPQDVAKSSGDTQKKHHQKENGRGSEQTVQTPTYRPPDDRRRYELRTQPEGDAQF